MDRIGEAGLAASRWHTDTRSRGPGPRRVDPATKLVRRGAERIPPRRGFGQRLEHVRSVVARLPVAGADVAFSAPTVHPDLKLYAVPERSVGGLAPLGLSKEGNSQNQCRRGLKGMPHSATRRVRGILTLMEDFKARLCFGTCSLPDEDLHRMAGTDMWPRFQRRYIDLITQHLKSFGDEALVVAVVEIGDFRAKRTGRPLPHIHFVCSGYGKRKPNGRWLFDRRDHDQIIEKAAQYSGLPRADRRAAGNIQPIRKSVANYVSKYLTKQAPLKSVDLSDGYEDLVPHQWWNRSEGAQALLDGHLFKLPPAFAMFMVQRQTQLEGMGLGKGGNVQIGVRKTPLMEMPIEVFRFQFRTPEALHQALELYALWAMAERQRLDSGGGGMWP